MKMFKASLETRTFSFEAYGKTEVKAKKFLIYGLLEHGHQYKLRDDWFEFYGDIQVREIESGVAYRDREELWSDK